MMVGGSSALNLSLLSRGVGEVSKNGHEKIDVVFEPQDYYNFVDSPSRVYLPPIQPSYTFEGPQFSTTSGHSKKPNHEAHIPKTFTTRKGALLLYSEDLAQRTRPTHHDRRSHFHHDHSHHLDERASHLSRSADEIDLRTVDDLAKSILSYGSQFEQYDEEKGMYLKFVHGRRKRDYFDRQIRPGFSAKRYLSSWTKCWDDQVLEKVISKGYLTEKSLFYYNPLMPHLQRRLNDDMSHYPTPYKLMRSMLMSPGSLSGYTFYRVRPESAETIATQDIETFGVQASQDAGASIRVISTKDGVQREVTYASLDRRAQEEVLTDLLVKSAVHYAMKKQQEFMDDSIARAMESGKIQEVPEERQTPVSVPQFDMKDAVESLLDAKKSGKNVLDTDFPDDKSHISEKSGSLRAKPPKHKRHGRDKQVTSRSTSPGGVEEHREYIGNIPVVQLKDGSGSPSSIPQLPQIPGALPLTPIGEASREQTTVVPLPPIKTDGQGVPALHVVPPTPQHSQFGSTHVTEGRTHRSHDPISVMEEEEEWNTGGGYPSKDQEERIHVEVSDSTSDKHKKDKKSMEGVHVVPSGGHSSSESMVSGASGKHGKPQWKGSQQSLKSVGSKKGSGSHEEAASLKGSVIIGPGDEPINVGGSIQPHARPDHVDTVQDANKVFGRDLLSDESDVDEPDEWKHSKKLPRGQRDALKNFANKREPVKEAEQKNSDQKIDYTSGDIDATLSINSWSYLPRDSEPEFEGIKKSSSVKSLPIIQGQKLSEQQIVDALTDHAQQIANNILSRSNSGRDLEDDVRSIVEEVVESQRRKSAGPTAGEYRELIRENLKTALSSVSGGGDIPVDAEVSPELLDALAKESVSPEDLEVVQDEETGKTVIRSKSQLSMTLGGVKEGHIYVPVAKNGQKVQGSIPDRQSNADIGELAVIHYGEKESVKDESEKSPSEKSVSLKSARSASEKGSKTKSQPPSIMGESIAEEEGEIPQDDAASEKKSRVSFKEEEQEEDEFKKAVEEIEKAEEKSEKSSKAPSKVGSTPDGKKSKASSATEKPPAAPTPKKKEEFVVGKVDTKDDIKALYGQPDPPPKEPSPPTMGRVDYKDELKHLFGGEIPQTKAKKTKGKPKPKKLPSPPKKAPPAQPAKPKGKGKPQKGKKKEDSPEPKPEEPPAPPKEPTPPPPPPKEPTPPPPKEPTPPPVDYESERESVASKPESEESFEFHFVRDSPSPSPPPQAPSIPSLEEEPEDEDEEIPDDEDDEAARLRMISNKEARAAKRAAQAEKRRQEVEKRRREREEQLKREKEEFERQQNLKAELEEERKKAEEARRLRKEKEREEEEREEKEELERARRRKMEEEREKRRKEEYAKKLEEMKKKQLEEEARKHEEMLRKQKEEEERRQAELEMMAQMAEAERIEYERKKKEEEEERLKREEEERKKREEEAQKAMEEARRLAEEMARRQAEMEARLKFTRTLQVEAKGLEHSQDITRAFVFSYFELLQWLGLDIPEFELLKLNQY